MSKTKKDNFGRVTQNFRGTKDFDGLEAKKRNFVTNVMRTVYENFGFEPLETPAIELARTLDGKYGEEGQKNLFKLSLRVDDTEAGLRYDHTVPLAKFMAMNPSSKVLPYRRYVIGKVWRNEAGGAGKWREFTQCDFDTVGSNSLIVDAEVLAINYQILTKLGFPNSTFEMQYNDRRLLNEMTSYIGCDETNAVEVLRAWDKLEKVGLKATVEELKEKKLLPSVIDNYEYFTQKLIKATNKFTFLENILGKDGEDSLTSINNIFQYALSMGVPEGNISFNPLLARGLDYYTGPIFEVVASKSGIGSISGGGRYDKLVGEMGGPDLPASGSSFGLERVLEVMDQLGIKIPVEIAAPVFITIFDQENLNLVQYSFEVASKLRLDGIPVEVYTGNQANLGKQFDIADRKGSKIALVIGPDELAKDKVAVKFLKTREQYTFPLSVLKEKVLSLLS